MRQPYKLNIGSLDIVLNRLDDGFENFPVFLPPQRLPERLAAAEAKKQPPTIIIAAQRLEFQQFLQSRGGTDCSTR